MSLALPAAPARPGAAARVAAHLDRLTGTPDEVFADIEALDEGALRGFGLQAVHLNLMSLLGGRWAPERVREAALRCTRMRLWRGWEHNVRYRDANLRMQGLASSSEEEAGGGGDDGAPVLAGWDAGALRAALAMGRGMLVCGFHFGSYRHVSTDLSRLGFRTTFAVDTRLVEQGRRGGVAGPPEQGFGVASIDDPAHLVALIRFLRGGGVVYLNVDANRGWGVGQGEQSFCPVEFAGMRLRVMTGAARLAEANGVVILPAAALPDGPRPGRVVCGPPLPPPPPGTRDPGFVSRTMQALYDFFEPHVEADPAEWQDVRFLHRWREAGASAPEPSPAEAAGALERRMSGGGALRLDPARCLRLEGGASLADARTLRTVQLPAWGVELAAALDTPQGVDGPWLQARLPDPTERERALLLMATLHARGLLASAAEPSR